MIWTCTKMRVKTSILPTSILPSLYNEDLENTLSFMNIKYQANEQKWGKDF